MFINTLQRELQNFLIIFFFILLIGSPFNVKASTSEELQTQVLNLQQQLILLNRASNHKVLNCPNISTPLVRDSNSEQVLSLQKFLIEKNILLPQFNTGYFGDNTVSAVQKYQCQALNICSGAPAVNGYGIIGTQTLSVLSQECSLKTASIFESSNLLGSVTVTDIGLLNTFVNEGYKLILKRQAEPSGLNIWTQTIVLKKINQ